MNIQMDKILRFWVDCEFGSPDANFGVGVDAQRTAQILRQYEEMGYAMRRLNSKGQISWKATPLMLSVLADLERDAEDDLADVR
jgi:hypothetical protein